MAELKVAGQAHASVTTTSCSASGKSSLHLLQQLQAQRILILLSSNVTSSMANKSTLEYPSGVLLDSSNACSTPHQQIGATVPTAIGGFTRISQAVNVG